MRPPKTTNQTRASKKIAHKILLAGLLVFIAGGSTLLYHHHTQQVAITKERAQFTQTEKDLNHLSTDIITNFGRPGDQTKINLCAYASRDLGHGPLGCSSNVYLSYAAKSADDAQQKTTKIQQLLNNTSYINYSEQINKPLNNVSPSDLGGGDYKDENNSQHCIVGYTYFEKSKDIELEGYPKINLDKSGFVIEITCGGPAKAAYYPIKN